MNNYADKKWFLIGAAITSDPNFWTNEGGQSNKKFVLNYSHVNTISLVSSVTSTSEQNGGVIDGKH